MRFVVRESLWPIVAGELEGVQAGLDQVAGGRVPTLVGRNRVQRIRSGLDPDDLRPLWLRVADVLPTPGPQGATANGRRDERVDRGPTEDQIVLTATRGGLVRDEQVDQASR